MTAVMTNVFLIEFAPTWNQSRPVKAPSPACGESHHRCGIGYHTVALTDPLAPLYASVARIM
jgi:hypothetical protein